jgi:hypothetical protein
LPPWLSAQISSRLPDEKFRARRRSGSWLGEYLHGPASREEARHDNEGDRDEIEDQQPVTELVRTDALAFVEFLQRPQTGVSPLPV